MSKRPNQKASDNGKPQTKKKLTGKFAGSSSSESDYSDGDRDDLNDWLVKDTEDADDDDDAYSSATTKKKTVNILTSFKNRPGQAKVDSFAGLDFESGSLADLFGSTSAKTGKDLTLDDLLNTGTASGVAGGDMGDDVEDIFAQMPQAFSSALLLGTTPKKAPTAPTSMMEDFEYTLQEENAPQNADAIGNGEQEQYQDDNMLDGAAFADIDNDPLLNPQAESTTTTTTTTTTMGQKELDDLRKDNIAKGLSIRGNVDKKAEKVYTNVDADLTTTNAEVNPDSLEAAALAAQNKAVSLGDLQNQNTGGDHLIYIYNIHEDSNSRDGKIYLFGRILVPQEGEDLTKGVKQENMVTKSICLCVQRVDRQVFFLPRKHPREGSRVDTQTEVSLDDVKEEITELLKDYGIEEKRMRVVKKKYCFNRRVAPQRFPQGKGNKPVVEEAVLEDLEELGLTEEQREEAEEEEINLLDEPQTTQNSIRDIARIARQYKDAYDASLIDPINVIPSEASYVEVRYPFSEPRFDQHLKGRTFSHVFGTQTSRQENFILDRSMMGPTWVRIPKSIGKLVDSHQMSWCDFEIALPDARNIKIYTPEAQEVDYPPPLFTAVSISIKTALSINKNNTWDKSIVAITLKTDHSLNIDLSKQKEQQLRYYQNTWTIVTPPPGGAQRLPFDFEQHRTQFVQAREKLKSELLTAPNEQRMLQLFLHKLDKINPDILVGHDLHGSMLDMLIHRIDSYKMGMQWSKLGRLKRANIPKPMKGTGNRSYVHVGAGAGRLLCDTQVSAKEFYPSKQYTLDHLSEQLLDLTFKPIESTKVAEHFATSKDLSTLIRIAILEAEAQFKLMHQLDIIPLTKQLTNLCGNTWYSSLRGVRSERVEYLLLHSFTRENFIMPEPPTQKSTPFNTVGLERDLSVADTTTTTTKASAKKKAKTNNDDDDEDDDNRTKVSADDEINGNGYFEDQALADSEEEDNGKIKQSRAAATTAASTSTASALAKKKKGASYAGGKVLEPKRGFYNEWISVLDFNSLYPSIIREYNLCFSTTPHWKMDLDGENPDLDRLLPGNTVHPGVLPGVVRMLIERRRAVRKLIPTAKDVKEVQQYNIKQLAFKLVANSLYGCLGFEHSRFFCRPIAATVTFKGRNALDVALREANTLGAKIIYGDTDSIMVNTQKMTHKDARNVAIKLKTNINKNFKVLTIDEDAYLKNMLLIKKKKYAAMKLEKNEKYDEKKFLLWQRDMSRPERLADSRKFLLQVATNAVLEGTNKTIDSPEIANNMDLKELFYFKREVKGLDMVRRDWSNLTRQASEQVLHILLNDNGQREATLAAVKDCLTQINDLIMADKMDLEMFIMTKQLTNSLQNYQDPGKLPHVAVATRMARDGLSVRQGDVIEYVITTTKDPNAGKSQGDRAVSRADYEGFLQHMKEQDVLAQKFSTDPANAGKSYQVQPYKYYPVDMELDLIYYKEQQLLVPILRLIEVIDDVIPAQFAECLGLDTAKYHRAQNQKNNGHNNADKNYNMHAHKVFRSNASLPEPLIDFADFPPLYIPCPHCNVAFPYVGVYSHMPIELRQQYDEMEQAEKNRHIYRNLPFQIHTPGYVAKMNQAPFKSGFICPTPGCPGLFNLWDPKNKIDLSTKPVVSLETIIESLCNSVTRCFRDYIKIFQRGEYTYFDKEHGTFTSNEAMINGAIPTSLVVTQFHVMLFLQYLLHLFDYTNARQLLQQESDLRITHNFASGITSEQYYYMVADIVGDPTAPNSTTTTTTKGNNNNNNNNNAKKILDPLKQLMGLLEQQTKSQLASFTPVEDPTDAKTSSLRVRGVDPNGIDGLTFTMPALAKTPPAKDFPELKTKFNWKLYQTLRQDRIAQLQNDPAAMAHCAPEQRTALWPLADLDSSLPDAVICVCYHVTQHILSLKNANAFAQLDLFDVFSPLGNLDYGHY